MPFEIGKVTKEDIRKASAVELLAAYRNPGLREEIERVANTPEPTPEEIAAAEVAAAKAETDALAEARAAEEVEAARLKAEADRIEADRLAAEAEAVKAAEKKKIVYDYQVTDEQGNPIGRPTHIEAWSPEELAEKLKKAHIEATRYAHRLKTRRDQAVYKSAEPARMTDAQIAAVAVELESEDKAVQEAARKRIEDDAKLVAKKQSVDQDALDRENVRQSAVSLEFMRNHVRDYNPCKANGQIIGDYIRNNNLEWTVENLELAFLETESQLVPVAEPAITKPAPAANPAEQAPTVAPAAIVAAQPAAQPTIPAGVAPPRASGGIEPGVTTTGRQPVAQTPRLTKADVRKWTPAEMRKQLKDPKVLAEFNLLFPQK
jgi:hypothetical protein